MGLGADMCEWAEENGYEGDDPYGAWVADLTYRASGGCCLEEVWAHEARGLKWNQETQRWLPAEQDVEIEEMPKKQARVVHTGTNAMCSACKRKKPQADFSKRQWNTKGARARCTSCVNANIHTTTDQ